MSEMTGTYTAAIDRIVDGETAVLLVEEDDRVIAQLDVPVDRLPAEGRTEGAILRVTLEAGEYVAADYQEATTAARRESARERLEELSRPLSERDEE